jgi:hypothetical protein
MSLEEVHDVVAGEGAVRPLDECLKQVELTGCEVLFLSPRSGQAATMEIKDPPIEAVALPASR